MKRGLGFDETCGDSYMGAHKLLLAIVFMLGCKRDAVALHHKPQTRAVTITAVPLLTKELIKIYPFLAADFGRGGILEGKEVYTFVPTNVTVFGGDTIRFTLINPEDEAHSFVLPGLAVTMPPQSSVNASYIARAPGVFQFECDLPAHKPTMYGELVVLPAR